MASLLFLLVLILAFVFFAGVGVAILSRGFGPYLRDRRQPLSVSQATALSKREEMIESFMHNFDRRFGDDLPNRDNVMKLEPVDWLATFKTEDGEEREFSISQSLYESLIIGDQGELAWRGHLFVRFRRPGIDREPKPEKSVPDDWL